jgi:hypothetical protein
MSQKSSLTQSAHSVRQVLTAYTRKMRQCEAERSSNAAGVTASDVSAAAAKSQ